MLSGIGVFFVLVELVVVGLTANAGNKTSENVSDTEHPTIHELVDEGSESLVKTVNDGSHCTIADRCDYELMSPRLTMTTAGVPGSHGFSGEAGPAEDARLRAPTGVSVDPEARKVYVADTGNHAARFIDLATAALSTLGGVLASPGIQGWHRIPQRQPELHGPQDIVVDPVGRCLYVADTEHHVIRRLDLGSAGTALDLSLKLPPSMPIVAGVLGSPGYAGDGGQATAAQLQRPRGVALDVLERQILYVSDTGNHAVRRVDLETGLLSTVAGVLGYGGPSSNERLATSTTLNFPYGLAVDAAARELYVTEPYNHVVRRVDLVTGALSTIAGVFQSPGTHGDGGPAEEAQLRFPYGVAVDPIARQLYVADAGNHAVRLVGPLGDRAGTAAVGGSAPRMTTVTIAGVLGESGDDAAGLAANSAQLRFPTGVALDLPARLLYVADKENHVVRRVDLQSRAMATIMGTLGSHGREGEAEAIAVQAQLQRPMGVAIGRGQVFVADTSAHAVRTVDLASGKAATLAGKLRASGCEPHIATNATEPEELQELHDGDNYSLPPLVIRRRRNQNAYSRYDDQACNSTPYTLDVRSGCNGWHGLTAEKCQQRCTLDATAPYCPRRTCVAAGFEPATGWCHLFDECRTLIPVASAAVFKKIEPDALLTFPSALVADSRNNDLYVADSGAHAVYRVNVHTGAMQLVAGRPCSPGFAGDGGNATDALLSSPSGVALDEAASDLYIADTANHAVRRINLDTGVIVTAIGVPGAPGCSKSAASPLDTRLRAPRGLAMDAVSRRLFLSDTGNHVVRVVDLPALQGESRAAVATGQSAQVVTIFAGRPEAPGRSNDGEYALKADLDSPYGIAAEEPTKWQLAMRVAGDSTAWVYANSDAWSTCGTYANGTDVKTSAYCQPLDRFKLVLRQPAGLESSLEFISDGRASLRELLSGNASLETAFGAASWPGMIERANLQKHCTLEGFMVSSLGASQLRCRFGMLSHADDTCPPPDSFVGLGCEARRANETDVELAAGGYVAEVAGDESRSWTADYAEVWIKAAIGSIYIADNQNHAVRRVSRQTGLLSTVAGVLGVAGHSGDQGRATKTELHAPTDVTVDSVARRLYVADASNHAVRVVAITGDVRLRGGAEAVVASNSSELVA